MSLQAYQAFMPIKTFLCYVLNATTLISQLIEHLKSDLHVFCVQDKTMLFVLSIL